MHACKVSLSSPNRAAARGHTHNSTAVWRPYRPPAAISGQVKSNSKPASGACVKHVEKPSQRGCLEPQQASRPLRVLRRRAGVRVRHCSFVCNCSTLTDLSTQGTRAHAQTLEKNVKRFELSTSIVGRRERVAGQACASQSVHPLGPLGHVLRLQTCSSPLTDTFQTCQRK